MTDQGSRSDGRWPTPALGGKQRAASSYWGQVAGRRGQQGGDITCPLIGHGRYCFVVLLGCQPMTDGICDDMLNVVEGIAGETVIKLMQEEKGIRERYGSDKKMYA
jgi:hypothetical protein